MHRLGSGQKVSDLAAAKREWIAAGRSPTTYCGKREWEAFEEDIGELVQEFPNGTQIRKHASVKIVTRGGSYGVAHNRMIIGNPIRYTKWREAKDAGRESGWMSLWTYYPNGMKLEELIAQVPSYEHVPDY